MSDEGMFAGMQGPAAGPGAKESVLGSVPARAAAGFPWRWMAAAAVLLAAGASVLLFPGSRPGDPVPALAGMPLPPFVVGADPAQSPQSRPVARAAALQDCGPRVDGPYRVHEWGLIPLGQKGLSLGADLPEFAQRYVEEGGVSMPPTAKPVLYFYPEKADCAWFGPDVRVTIPGGKLAYFWPPGVLPEGKTLLWNHNILGLAPDPAKARPVPKGHWMETARDVDAIWLHVHARDKADKTVDETERFLFYDGYVPYVWPLKAKAEKDGTVKVSYPGDLGDPIHDLLLLRNAGGKTSLAHAGRLAPKEDVVLTPKACEDPVKELTRLLVAAGLYEKEAAGMAKIWKKDFFARDGDWVLWRLDPKTVDALQPLTLDPKPVEAVRVHLVLAPLSLLTGNP